MFLPSQCLPGVLPLVNSAPTSPHLSLLSQEKSGCGNPFHLDHTLRVSSNTPLDMSCVPPCQCPQSVSRAKIISKNKRVHRERCSGSHWKPWDPHAPHRDAWVEEEGCLVHEKPKVINTFSQAQALSRADCPRELHNGNH